MASLAYWEDALFDSDDLLDDNIQSCTDQTTLLEWMAATDAVVEDIKGQVEVSALGGLARSDWIYRCSKAVGLQKRAASRIKSRLLVLGWTPPAAITQAAEFHRKFIELKARNAIAVEFLRLCTEGAIPDRELFHTIESKAAGLVAAREGKRAKAETP